MRAFCPLNGETKKKIEGKRGGGGFAAEKKKMNGNVIFGTGDSEAGIGGATAL